jgi:FMN phosphatase YigB (HAD superfamily)
MNLLKVNTILCDIDATVTDVYPEHSHDDFRDRVFNIFARHIACRKKISLDEAHCVLDDFSNNLLRWWDYPDFITYFDLDPIVIWQEMRQVHQKMLYVYEDAVKMIKYLHTLKKNLYIVSNNPVTGCLLKLEIAGLADLSGTPYFKRIFGTNVTRGMKSQALMWKRIVANLGVASSEILIIGDSIKEDFIVPHSIGIGNTIIVDRKAKNIVEKIDDYIIVNNLGQVNEKL